MSEIDTENRETSLEQYARQLSDYDMVDLSERLVSLDNEEKQQIEEKSTVVSKYTAELKRIAADKQRIIHMMRTREEVVEEECYFEYDYTDGMLFYYSVATDEIVKSREITNEERQLKMFADKKEAKEKEEESESLSNAPMCHMKKMTFLDIEEDGSKLFICEVCKSEKTIKPEDQ
jgi:hypothetical protein